MLYSENPRERLSPEVIEAHHGTHQAFHEAFAAHADSVDGIPFKDRGIAERLMLRTSEVEGPLLLIRFSHSDGLQFLDMDGLIVFKDRGATVTVTLNSDGFVAVESGGSLPAIPDVREVPEWIRNCLVDGAPWDRE